MRVDSRQDQKRLRQRRAQAIRRRKIRRLKIIGMLAALIIVGWGTALIFQGQSSKAGSESAEPAVATRTVPDQTSTGIALGEGTGSELQQLAAGNPEIEQIIQNSHLYPEELLTMLAKNLETLDYVRQYPDRKGGVPSTTLDEAIVRGEIPLLIQWDSRWGYAAYGERLLGFNGCGPTAIAMVAAGLTGRSDITPYTVAEYCQNNGLLAETNDTSWDLMTTGCMEFGITGTELGLQEDVMATTLDNGLPIICSVGPGDFTDNGHFIVLTGYQDGKFRINDPNSRIRSERLWSYAELADQIVNMWYFQEI